jgi:hypothetical protein
MGVVPTICDWALGRAFLIQGDGKQAIEDLNDSVALGHYSLGYARHL